MTLLIVSAIMFVCIIHDAYKEITSLVWEDHNRNHTKSGLVWNVIYVTHCYVDVRWLGWHLKMQLPSQRCSSLATCGS